MNKLIVLLLAVAAWWYWFAARQINDQQVREFYSEMERATLSRDPEALCALFAEDFQTSGSVESAGVTKAMPVQNKQQTCDNYRQLFASFEKIGVQMGGMLQLDVRQTLNSVEISPDKRSATVDFEYQMDVGGSIMNMRSHSVDVLVRQNGKVLLQRSTGEGAVSSG